MDVSTTLLSPTDATYDQDQVNIFPTNDSQVSVIPSPANPFNGADNDYKFQGYSIVAVTLGCICVITNTSMLLLICLRQKLRNPSNMILCSMFIAGILYGGLYIIPTEGVPGITRIMPFCFFLPLVSQSLAININYHLSLISYDRYYHVAYPLNSKFTPAKKYIGILIIWITSISLPCIILFSLLAPYVTDGCGSIRVQDQNMILMLKLFPFLLFVVPLGLTIIFYMGILYEIWSRKYKLRYILSEGQVSERRHQLKKIFHAIKHILLVIGIFTICWLPNITIAYIDISWPSIVTFFNVYWTSILLIFFNVAINPLVYLFNTYSLQREMKAVLCSFKSCSLKSRIVKRSESVADPIQLPLRKRTRTSSFWFSTV